MNVKLGHIDEAKEEKIDKQEDCEKLREVKNIEEINWDDKIAALTLDWDAIVEK
jgi:hypothetical protein